MNTWVRINNRPGTSGEALSRRGQEQPSSEAGRRRALRPGETGGTRCGPREEKRMKVESDGPELCVMGERGRV